MSSDKSIVQGNLIDGAWVPARSGKTFEDRNPAKWSEVVGIFPRSGPEDIEDAVAAALRAASSWRQTPAPRRAEIVLKAIEWLTEHKEECARQMTREMGKVLSEARGDVQEAIDMGLHSVGEGRRLFGLTTPSELPDKLCLTFRKAVGVCGLITPWNFPMAIPSWKVFPALVAGNTVVLKPASDTPASAATLAKALVEAGLPNGVLNVVFGEGSVLGNVLVNHPKVQLISFTGSSEVGRIISTATGQTMKKCSMELGGKNGQVVLEDADLDLALEGALWGAFGTSGQRCTATSRLIVHEAVYDRLVAELITRTKNLRLGNGLDAGVDVGPVVNEGQLKKIAEYVRIGQEEGAELATGGERETRAGCAEGWFFKPTIFLDVKPEMRIAQEEIFGPVLVVIKVKSFEEALQVLNETHYGLSASVYTKDITRAMRAVRDIETGITYINGPTIGAEVHLPFGGLKESGNGHRDAGWTVYDIFTEWQTVFIDYSGKLQRAQIDVA